jgi:hypothetical protein
MALQFDMSNPSWQEQYLRQQQIKESSENIGAAVGLLGQYLRENKGKLGRAWQKKLKNLQPGEVPGDFNEFAKNFRARKRGEKLFKKHPALIKAYKNYRENRQEMGEKWMPAQDWLRTEQGFQTLKGARKEKRGETLKGIGDVAKAGGMLGLSIGGLPLAVPGFITGASKWAAGKAPGVADTLSGPQWDVEAEKGRDKKAREGISEWWKGVKAPWKEGPQPDAPAYQEQEGPVGVLSPDYTAPNVSYDVPVQGESDTSLSFGGTKGAKSLYDTKDSKSSLIKAPDDYSIGQRKKSILLKTLENNRRLGLPTKTIEHQLNNLKGNVSPSFRPMYQRKNILLNPYLKGFKEIPDIRSPKEMETMPGLIGRDYWNQPSMEDSTMYKLGDY